ncbi:MAG: type II secretion system minor pseudopilin GspJ [Xanthomonadales bacterium]|nr:type II secretion system minor pseudopilin GspJ [Xanthomonadales bacterium]
MTPRNRYRQPPLVLNTAQRGFSLLEVIIAVAVFGLVAAAGYAGLDQLSRAAAAQRDASARMEALQLSIALFEQDISQIIARPVTLTSGRTFDPVNGDHRQISFTRSGWANPLALPRSELKRVEWRFDGNRLQRWLWNVLDRSESEVPVLDSELENIADFRLRYLDSQGDWVEQWPPRNQAGEAVSLSIPQAIEISFYREPRYRVRRVVEINLG